MLFLGALNPYRDKDFLQFFVVLGQRLFQFLSGSLPLKDLASDEIQLLVLVLVATASALVGSFLVLKNMTMLANSLSHTILLGLVSAYLIFFSFDSIHGSYVLSLNALLVAALITAILTTLLTEFLTQMLKLQEDASIGLVFTTLFALSIVLVTIFTRNAHLGTEAVTGSVDALHFDDLRLVFWVALFDLIIVVLFFKLFKATTFDSSFSISIGIPTAWLNYLLMVQTAATAIGAFRAVGILLFLSFIVGPPLTARLLTHRLRTLLILSAVLGASSSILAVACARHFLSRYRMPLSTSGLVVLMIALVYLLTFFLTSLCNVIRKQRCILSAQDGRSSPDLKTSNFFNAEEGQRR
ncbi:MAG: metal ABC transporter permease [Anaerolineae bacterium]